MIQSALQIAEGDVGVDGEPFNLVEHGRVAGVRRIVAIDLARNHNAQRRLQLLHGANLHRRGVRAQQQPVAQSLLLLPCEEQGVLHVARGMVGRKVQRLEIVVIGLDLGALGNRVAKIAEHAHHLVHRADHGVLGAKWTSDAGQGDIDAFGIEAASGSAVAQPLERRVDRSFNLRLQFVDALTRISLGFFGRGLEPEFVDLRGDAVFAGHPAIAEELVFVLAIDAGCFGVERGQQIARGCVQRG